MFGTHKRQTRHLYFRAFSRVDLWLQRQVLQRKSSFQASGCRGAHPRMSYKRCHLFPRMSWLGIDGPSNNWIVSFLVKKDPLAFKKEPKFQDLLRFQNLTHGIILQQTLVLSSALLLRGGRGRGDATPVPSQSCTCLTSQQDFILYNLKFVALYTIYPCVRRCIVIMMMMMMTIIMTILIHNRNPWALIKRQDKLCADQLVWIRRKQSPLAASCFGKKCSRIPCSSRSADEILLALHQRRSYGQVQMKSVVCFTIFSKKSSSDVFAAV